MGAEESKLEDQECDDADAGERKYDLNPFYLYE